MTSFHVQANKDIYIVFKHPIATNSYIIILKCVDSIVTLVEEINSYTRVVIGVTITITAL